MKKGLMVALAAIASSKSRNSGGVHGKLVMRLDERHLHGFQRHAGARLVHVGVLSVDGNWCEGCV